MLASHGVPQKGATEILSYVENSHYQLACQKHFEITHAVSSSGNTSLEIICHLSLSLSHTHRFLPLLSASSTQFSTSLRVARYGEDWWTQELLL